MIKKFITDIKNYRGYILYSARAELKSEVANSYLNWVWWILEPLSFMLIYAFIFGCVFNSSELYFAVFIYLGLTIWDFFSRNITNSVKMVKNNKPIVTKIYIPKFILVLSKMGVNFFKMLISFAITLILMVIYQVPISLNVLYVFMLLIELGIFVFGVMCILLHFGVYVTDLSNVVKIGLKMMFYFTGVFYSIQGKLGEKYALIADILSVCNPIAYILTSFREALLYSQAIDLRYYFIWLIVSLLLAIYGVKLVYKNENSYVKVI